MNERINFQNLQFLAQTLLTNKLMNLIELIIIYLACGAPFGVYYFLHQKEFFNSSKLWLNSILVTLFWIPYAFRLFHSFVTTKFLKSQFAENTFSDSAFKDKIDEIEKKFAQILLEEKVDFSIFEFRETFQRFVGLTIVTKDINYASLNDETEHDLFSITNHQNGKLATKCLNRRNRLRLKAHQNLALKDFLQMLQKIDSCLVEKEKFSLLAIDFVKLLDDVQTQIELNKVFQNLPQTVTGFPVKKMENEVWNPIETKQLPTHKTHLNLPTLSASVMMSKRD